MGTHGDRYAHVRLDVDPGGARGPAHEVRERAFDILVVGDLGGSSPRVSSRPLPERRPVLVDRDTLDEVLARYSPGVSFRLDGAGPVIDIAFTCIDDFHPDNLIRRVPLLASLAELREDVRLGRAVLAGPAGDVAPDAAAAPSPVAPAATLPDDASAPGAATGGSLLDMIVDDASAAARPSPAPRPSTGAEPSDLHGYIRSVLAPHIVPGTDARQTALAAQLDDTLASLLRAILHHPDVQALESIWRGVSLLVHRLETGVQLRVFLLDASPTELAADLESDDAVEGSALLDVLARGADETPGAAPWAVVAGHYTFDGSAADAALLGRIAAIARYAGAPFIAAAAPALVGLASLDAQPDAEDVRPAAASAWLALRRSALAAGVALALPRFLLRQPYDPREAPCEGIAFQEMQAPPVHGDYLWGNPSIVCALLLGRTFEAAGWQMRPLQLELESLPLYLYRDAGETVAKPCAETLLTDRVASRILDAGVTPLLSLKNGDSVRLAALQSIADPPAPLAGAWFGS